MSVFSSGTAHTSVLGVCLLQRNSSHLSTRCLSSLAEQLTPRYSVSVFSSGNLHAWYSVSVFSSGSAHNCYSVSVFSTGSAHACYSVSVFSTGSAHACYSVSVFSTGSAHAWYSVSVFASGTAHTSVLGVCLLQRNSSHLSTRCLSSLAEQLTPGTRCLSSLAEQLTPGTRCLSSLAEQLTPRYSVSVFSSGTAHASELGICLL